MNQFICIILSERFHLDPKDGPDCTLRKLLHSPRSPRDKKRILPLCWRLVLLLHSPALKMPQPTQLSNLQSVVGRGWPRMVLKHCLKVSAVQKEGPPVLGVLTWKDRKT